MDIKCKGCKHSIFDETWGEYKCKKLYRRIYDPASGENCALFEADNKDKKQKQE